jgi:hypothetical protein
MNHWCRSVEPIYSVTLMIDLVGYRMPFTRATITLLTAELTMEDRAMAKSRIPRLISIT